MSARDYLFIRFVTALFVLLLLYGAGMFVVIALGHESVATRMISGFGTMFAGILGLGSGYLLGAASAAAHATNGSNGEAAAAPSDQ